MCEGKRRCGYWESYVLFVTLLNLFQCGFQPTGAIFWAGCANLSHCSGHGECISRMGPGYAVHSCECWHGWGSPVEEKLTGVKTGAIDCSRRTCKSGVAWADKPTSATTAHYEAECSNAGVCDRKTGTCQCFVGFSGAACSVHDCPSAIDGLQCSGHGRCLPMKYTQYLDEALPLTKSVGSYKERSTANASNKAWDASVSHHCVCDSSWSVGAR